MVNATENTTELDDGTHLAWAELPAGSTPETKELDEIWKQIFELRDEWKFVEATKRQTKAVIQSPNAENLDLCIDIGLIITFNDRYHLLERLRKLEEKLFKVLDAMTALNLHNSLFGQQLGVQYTCVLTLAEQVKKHEEPPKKAETES